MQHLCSVAFLTGFCSCQTFMSEISLGGNNAKVLHHGTQESPTTNLDFANGFCFNNAFHTNNSFVKFKMNWSLFTSCVLCTSFCIHDFHQAPNRSHHILPSRQAENFGLMFRIKNEHDVNFLVSFRDGILRKWKDDGKANGIKFSGIF